MTHGTDKPASERGAPPPLATRLDLDGGRRLWLVPSVHFRLAFAEQVNRLCSAAASRPNAVVVELDPDTAAAAAQWLAELGVGPGRRSALPCMLALVRAEGGGGAVATEADLPADRRPRTNAARVLYLSPTDSIVEAVRCALELRVPLYGVDLDVVPGGRPPGARRGEGVMLQDPAAASGRGQAERYTVRNVGYARALRDDATDGLPEAAMAAGLKAVLARHRRVLFVFGLAHWEAIHRLLHDPSVGPADGLEGSTADAAPTQPPGPPPVSSFRRAVVHPLLAVRYTDVLPVLAGVFEAGRTAADRPLAGPVDRPVDVAAVVAELLDAAYREHFRDRMWPQVDGQAATGAAAAGRPREQLDRLLEDWEARPDFERLLAHLALVRQQTAPDVFSLMAAACGTMSPAFCRVLAKVLMRFDWASPADHPGLPVLAPAPAPAPTDSPAGPLDGQLIAPDGSRGGSFPIDPRPRGAGGAAGAVGVGPDSPIPWDWRAEPPAPLPPRPAGAGRASWAPRDFLTTALSLRAIDLSRGDRPPIRSAPFEGSLLDGIDVKSTLRAHAAGGGRVYVRDARPGRRLPPAGVDGYPVVWLFRPGTAREGGGGDGIGRDGSDDGPGAARRGWYVFSDALDDLRPRVRNPAALDRLRQSSGRSLIHAIAFGRYTTDERLSRPGWRVERLDLDGIVFYQPGHFTPGQTARWAEETGYRRHPVHDFVPGPGLPAGLAASVLDRHGFDPSAGHWATALVRLAVPYAASAVTVVAPDGFRLPPAALSDAARRGGLPVRLVPMSYFPVATVRTISTYLVVPVLGYRPSDDTPEYPPHLQQLLGERPTANRRLVPDRLLADGPAGPPRRADAVRPGEAANRP